MAVAELVVASRGAKPFTVERTAPRCITVRMKVGGPNWERWFLLRSDAHHDNQHCDQALERRHLSEAQEREAGILDIGDLFCAMEGKWDKRADQNALRPEYRGNNYLDLLKKHATDFYAPFSPLWVMMSPGNHETAILKHHQTDLTVGLAERLNDRTGSGIEVGKYNGWVRFQFFRGTGWSASKKLYYTHGYGGGGPVTRDVIQTNRMAVYAGGADLVWSGHTHDAFEVPIVREELDALGAPILRETIHVKTPGYKEEYSPGEGYHAEKGRPPKPLGACWLRFTYRGRPDRIEIETQRAK